MASRNRLRTPNLGDYEIQDFPQPNVTRAVLVHPRPTAHIPTYAFGTHPSTSGEEVGADS